MLISTIKPHILTQLLFILNSAVVEVSINEYCYHSRHNHWQYNGSKDVKDLELDFAVYLPKSGSNVNVDIALTAKVVPAAINHATLMRV